MSRVHENVGFFRNDCRGDNEDWCARGREPLVAEGTSRELLPGPADGQYVSGHLFHRERVRDLDREGLQVLGDLVHVEVRERLERREREVARRVEQPPASRVPTAAIAPRSLSV